MVKKKKKWNSKKEEKMKLILIKLYHIKFVEDSRTHLPGNNTTRSLGSWKTIKGKLISGMISLHLAANFSKVDPVWNRIGRLNPKPEGFAGYLWQKDT